MSDLQTVSDCPDPAVCQRVKFHVHGHLWHLWQTRLDYRMLWEALADGKPWPPPGLDPQAMNTHVPTSGRSGHALVAPLGTRDCPMNWQGCSPRKSWEYALSVMIPTIGNPDLVAVAVGLLRHQLCCPYFILVDTGSDDPDYRALELLRADDLEIHYVRGHGYIHSSAPVSLALDVGLAACQTEYLLLTHADVFARRKDWTSYLYGLCDKDTPVVGWEQSPRGPDGWQGCVSHTSTMLYMPVIRASGATWNWKRYYAAVGMPAGMTVGYPDTEQPFNLCLKAAGITPKLLGREFNYQKQQTQWWDHARSWPGLRPYKIDTPVHNRVEAYGKEILTAARQRLAEWDREKAAAQDPPAPQPSFDRGLSCKHIGDQVGLRECPSCQGTVRLKEYRCNHPGHTARPLTTLPECRKCGDFEEKPAGTRLLKLTVAVICYNRPHNLDRWVAAWKQMEGRENSTLLLVCTGDFPEPCNLPVDARFIRLPNRGMDIGAVQRLIAEPPIPYDLLLWSPDDMFPMRRDWISLYRDKFYDPLLGGVGSFWSAVPVSHVRSGGVCLRREVAENLRWPTDLQSTDNRGGLPGQCGLAKTGCYRFEFLDHNFWKQVTEDLRYRFLLADGSKPPESPHWVDRPPDYFWDSCFFPQVANHQRFHKTFSGPSMPIVAATPAKTDTLFTMLPYCLACGLPVAQAVVDLGDQVPANTFHDGSNIPAAYPLKLMRCEACGHLQLSVAVSPEVLYSSYAFSTRSSGPLCRHLDRLAEWIAERKSGGDVLEIGCNDGYLMTALRRRAMQPVGIDLAGTFAEQWRKDDLRVINAPFTAEAYSWAYGTYDVVVGTNVFAHLGDPRAALRLCAAVLKTDGMAVFEVHSAEAVILKGQFDMIYHDHLSYFTVRSAAAVAEGSGLSLVAVERPSVHGGSLRLVYRRGVPTLPQDDPAMDDPETYRNYAAQVREKGKALRELVEPGAVCFCASGRAITMAQTYRIPLAAFVDETPLKQNKFAAGQVPVQSWEWLVQERPKQVVNGCWNYYAHVRQRLAKALPGTRLVSYQPEVREEVL